EGKSEERSRKGSLSRERKKISLGFFDDIYVPAHHMPYPNHFVEDEQGKRKGVWFWDFNEQEYPIQETDVIKFRVQNVSYPQIPVEQPKESKPFAPMLVTVSILLIIKPLFAFNLFFTFKKRTLNLTQLYKTSL
ncbi:hypothetical protein LR48_Vigan11g134600, partial [Vigna angularis]